MLITLEGIDGSGKTTVWKSLQEKLSSEEFTFTREPTDSKYGELLRENLSNDTEDKFTELFLFMADHANHVSSVIAPVLADSEMIICDRYIDSRCAYQGYTLREEMETPVEFIYESHQGWSRFPDVTILLDVTPETSIERLNTDEKFETKEKLRAIRENYGMIAENDEQRFHIVDAEQEKETVLETIQEIIHSEIDKRNNK